MKLIDIYRAAVAFGSKMDPRGEKQVKEDL